MKTVIFVLGFMVVNFFSYAQKIYKVEHEYQADLKVYIVKHEYQADGNKGLWFFTKHDYQADKKVFFVEHEYQADLKIYFVEYEYQAGWVDKSKQYLLY